VLACDRWGACGRQLGVVTDGLCARDGAPAWLLLLLRCAVGVVMEDGAVVGDWAARERVWEREGVLVGGGVQVGQAAVIEQEW